LLIQNSIIRSHPAASQQNQKSVRKWYFDAQNTIAKEEAAYITKQDDLVQLVPKTTTQLQIIPEKMTAWYKAVYDRPDNPASIGTGIATAGALMLSAPSWIWELTDKLMACATTGLMMCYFTVVALTVACFTAAVLAVSYAVNYMC
jgi:hypothetical protein